MREDAVETLEWRGVRYRRWREAHDGAPRGSVMLPDGRMVFGYPSIGRILDLRAGVSEHFGARAFWAEEKVDGYNVRVVRWGRRLLAFTRGGFLCPYTTDRVRGWLPRGLFREMPDLVLCLEVAGPETPYTDAAPPGVQDDARPFAFDAMRLDHTAFLSRSAFYALADRWRLPTVERLGRFTLADLPRLRAALDRYERERREGVVLKSDDGARRVKYTTSASAIDDLAIGSAWIAELAPAYFTNRVLRLALSIVERGDDAEARAAELGEAMLLPLIDALRGFAQERRVARRYRCRLHARRAALELIRHLRRHGGHAQHLRRRRLERGADGMWLLEFEREPPTLNGLLHHLLRGGAMFD